MGRRMWSGELELRDHRKMCRNPQHGVEFMTMSEHRQHRSKRQKQQIPQRPLHFRKLERIPRRERLLRQYALAFRNDLRRFAEHDAQRESGRRQKTRPAQGFAERVAELLVRHRIRSDRVERTVDFGMIEREQDQADLVLVVNPAHELLAGADRTADAHLEGRQHLSPGAPPSGSSTTPVRSSTTRQP